MGIQQNSSRNGFLVQLLLAWRWWDLPPAELAEAVPLLCDPDLDAVRTDLRRRLGMAE